MLSSTFIATKAGPYKAVRLTSAIAALILLTDCASLVPKTPPVNIQDEANANADHYLQ
jgi:outer membrane PBP1 activator LpoA protein